MDKHWADFTGRLPHDVYRNALDLSRVFKLSLSEWLATAVSQYVEAQLARPVVSAAVKQVREARGSRAGAGPREARPTGGRR